MLKLAKTLGLVSGAGLVMTLMMAACLRVATDSSHAAEAKQRAATLGEQEALDLFKSVENASKASIIERFIKDHPYPKVVLLGRIRIAELDYKHIETQNPFRPSRPGNDTWQGFVNYYAFTDYIPIPDDPEMQEAYYKRLHTLIIRALGEVNSFDLWMRYMSLYSQNPYFSQAAEQMEKFLITRSDRWEGYEILKKLLALWEERVKQPYPNGEMLVRKFQEGLAAVVEREDRMDAYRRYLDTFPDSPLKKRIILRVDHLELRDACVRGDQDKMKEIIRKYENDKDPLAQADVRMAVSQLEQIEYRETAAAGTSVAFRQFIARYKDRDYAKLVREANSRLMKLHDQMLVKARATGHSRLYRQFLESFPESPQKAAVEKEMHEAEFREAIARKDRDGLKKLRDLYPNSSMAPSALEHIEAWEFDQAQKSALAELTTAPLRAFLKDHPKGKHAGGAQDLMDSITGQHNAYVAELQKARDADNASQFATWLIENASNNYASKRGKKDLESLKNEIDVRQLISDLTTTAAAPSRAVLPIAQARALSDAERVVAFIETSVSSGTGFIFGRNGLLLTNAHLVWNADPKKIKTRMARQNRMGTLVSASEPSGPDLAVVHIEGTYDPINVGNSAALATGEGIICLSGRSTKVETAKGRYLRTRRVGANEWLIIQSTEISPTHGGVILNQRARAIGILVRPENVDPAAKENAPGILYALSLRSALPMMEKAILAP